MKTLIVYASCGAGHQACAEAIYAYLSQKSKAQIESADALDKTYPLFGAVYRYGYNLLVKYGPWFWALLYNITAHQPFVKLSRWLNAHINIFYCREFIGFLARENPDVIISTHFLPAQLAACLKEEEKIRSCIISVVTDLGAHPFWANKGTDLYLAAGSHAKNDLIRWGVSADIIRESGIPVGEKFLQDFDRGACCRKLGLDPGKFTALIITGSFGIGPIEEIVEGLQGQMQILVVCAGNKSLYAGLKKRNFADVLVFGFVHNMPDLMACADVIITKPGGLSISEALARGLIPVFISVIPGQEAGNVRVLQDAGIGLLPKDSNEAVKTVLRLKDKPADFSYMKDNIRRFRKTSALKELMDVIRAGSAEPGC